MTIQVNNIQEFKRRWNGVINFLVSGECLPMDIQLPPIDKLVDGIRKDARARILTGGPVNKQDISESFRALSIQDALCTEVSLAHFDLSRFDKPSGLLEGFYDRVMLPWQTLLTKAGFTWERCYPAMFISGPRCQSSYHMDVSHVLACQVYGHKRFCGMHDPYRWAPVEVRKKWWQDRDSNNKLSKPSDLTEDDVLAYDMSPGTALWNTFLTPHWVPAGDEMAVSVNISHGGLRLSGQLCPHEVEYREWQAEEEQTSSTY